jgi:hypothetical protein
MSFLRSSTTFSRLTRQAPLSYRHRAFSITPYRSAAGGESPEDASSQSGGSRSKEAKETGSSPTGGQVGNTGVGAQPKIHDNRTPSADGEEYQKEVEQHNQG